MQVARDIQATQGILSPDDPSFSFHQSIAEFLQATSSPTFLSSIDSMDGFTRQFAHVLVHEMEITAPRTRNVEVQTIPGPSINFPSSNLPSGTPRFVPAFWGTPTRQGSVIDISESPDLIRRDPSVDLEVLITGPLLRQFLLRYHQLQDRRLDYSNLFLFLSFRLIWWSLVPRRKDHRFPLLVCPPASAAIRLVVLQLRSLSSRRGNRLRNKVWSSLSFLIIWTDPLINRTSLLISPTLFCNRFCSLSNRYP